MSKQYNDKIMKSIYYLALVLSLSLIGTVSQAQSLAGIQDMVADQPVPLDLVADQASALDLSADQISGQDVEINESAIFEPAAYKGLDFFASEESVGNDIGF